MLKDNIKKFYIWIIIIFIITLFFLIYLINFNIKIEETINKDTIYNNIYINNIEVSGLTKEEAVLYLNEQFSIPKYITLICEGTEYKFTQQDFSIQYDIESAVNKAYEIGRTGKKLEKYKTIKQLQNIPQNITAERYFNEELIKEKLQELESLLYVNPTNATVVKNSDGFKIIENVNGEKIDFDKMLSDTLNLVQTKDEGIVYIDKEVIYSDYKSELFNNFGDLLGSFATSFTRTNSNKGRIANIELASSKINGVVLYPAETFSTYAKFGDTTAENGYKLAPTIINGNLVDDYGGGICQVSSTLYNAVLLSELEVVERKNHSLKVSYLDYGFDATIAGNYIDFKFKNSYEYPIYIESYVTENSIVCNIYGIETRAPERSIKFETSLVQVIEPEEPKITYTDDLYKGVVKTKVTELKGYKYKLYKLVYENDVLIEKILINDSNYKPRSAEILIGTRE